MHKTILATLLILVTAITGFSQQKYEYSVDLTKADNDQLHVVLKTPPVDKKEIKFFMPKIVPGTYVISDYGKFVGNLKALDQKGRELPVERLDENSWKISKANKMASITYTVDDTYDTDMAHQIYPMAGTNIEEGVNYVIGTAGFFGYFEGMKKMPFQVSFTKPASFYGSTGLKPIQSTETNETYQTSDYDELVDSPIMFNEPDTTFINVGNARVLVSVYSPNGLVTSGFLAQQLKKLLEAEKEYLGGKLPVDKYAFIYYFDDSETPQPGQGALEHSYSSYYYLSETPQEQIIGQLMDIASHEFLHIVTPLTIHSEEIGNFNFNVPEMSQHLWLYEGVTEYASDHVQVQYDLISIPEYLNKLQEKILISKMYYNDSLSFTELSTKSADIHQEQYGNVYEKGALIAAMLDIRLNELSKGEMDIQVLLRKLAEKYGMDKPFKDEELFDVITKMTYPEIGEFFKKYVIGTQPLPFKDYFEKVGIDYVEEKLEKKFSLGQIQIGYDPVSGHLLVADISKLNEFGKALGYKKGDLLLTIQGQDFTPQTGQQLLQQLNENIKEGDMLTIGIRRDGEELTLKQKVYFVEVPVRHQISIKKDATYEQVKLRNQWLKANPITARTEDVNSIDAIMKSLYDVISGPAGERDWERFKSLFTPEAKMAAMAPTPHGVQYFLMTPDEYKENNSPIFEQSGFFEEEIGRTTNKYENIAHVFSAYQYKTEQNGPVLQRGINSIQLAYFENRWWITSLLWNGEGGEKIPAEYLKK